MEPRRRTIELSVERPLRGGDDRAPSVARLRAIFEIAEGADPPSADELARTLATLRADLERVVGEADAAARPSRAERSLTELVETYRPRQADLVEALRADGELTELEHALLAEHLRGGSPSPARRGPPTASTGSDPVAAPSGRARPVEELLSTYRIESLKQAGAVRARRQISYDEYMALKRHFGSAAAG